MISLNDAVGALEAGGKSRNTQISIYGKSDQRIHWPRHAAVSLFS